MKSKKIKVLVHPSDRTGVGYYRSTKPHIALESFYPEDFHVDIDYQPKYNDEEWLKQYDIIHYHRTFGPYEEMEKTLNLLDKLNILSFMDIDDHWAPGTHHPAYHIIKQTGMDEKIKNNLKLARNIITTTEAFASVIRPINKNVYILANAIDPTEKQYIPTPEPSNRLRIAYLGGSSHLHDLKLLEGVAGQLKRDNLLDKMQFVLCGFDLRGTMTIIDSKTGQRTQRPIRPMESVWYKYEQIFTDNYNIVSDDYKKFLLSFKNEEYSDISNEPYRRVWTKPITTYASNYNLFDVSLAPIEEHTFNFCKCVVGDSLISTDNGFIEIQDIVNKRLPIKTEVNNEFNKVVNYFKYENEPTIKIKTKDGYTIEGTKTHRLLINNEWVKLSDLKIGNEIELTAPNFNQTKYQEITYPMLLTKNTENKIDLGTEDMLPRIIINENWGRLLGYLLGDGHLGGKSMVGISFDKRHPEVINDALNLLTSIGLNPKLYPKKVDKRCNNNLSKEGFGVDLKLTSKTFINIAKKYGWIGSNGKTFRVPKIILQSPKSVIKEFLRGLFEADGTVGENCGVSLSSKDLNLIQQVQTLLLGFNIQSKIGRNYNKIYRKYYYTLSLRRLGSEIFANEIGFISKVKIDKLNTLITNKHSNNEFKMTFKDEIIEIIESNNDVYDIEVEKVHKYNANGIINHNSQLKVVEAGFHKKAIIAQDYGPYQIDLKPYLIKSNDKRKPEPIVNKDGNALLVSTSKNHKDWYRNIKRLIQNPEMVKELSTNLYDTVKDTYSMEAVCKNRRELYISKLNNKI